MEILHQPDSVHLAPAPGAIPSDEIASVMALSLGLSIPKVSIYEVTSKVFSHRKTLRLSFTVHVFII